MRITDVLRRKGATVVTITPDRTVTHLLESLAEHRVGALVVSRDGATIDGIVSERDVVRRLHSDGPGVLAQPIHAIMTATVRTCRVEDTVDDLMRLMTEHRFRHVPVVTDGRLVGIVSIGDVVKHRIDELQSERDHLTAYITG
jgi:CBS domain-containing protein